MFSQKHQVPKVNKKKVSSENFRLSSLIFVFYLFKLFEQHWKGLWLSLGVREAAQRAQGTCCGSQFDSDTPALRGECRGRVETPRVSWCRNPGETWRCQVPIFGLSSRKQEVVLHWPGDGGGRCRQFGRGRGRSGLPFWAGDICKCIQGIQEAQLWELRQLRPKALVWHWAHILYAECSVLSTPFPLNMAFGPHNTHANVQLKHRRKCVLCTYKSLFNLNF